MANKRLIKTITFPKIEDDAILCFGQVEDHIPFPFKRIYYILKPQKGEPRGFHAHRSTDQVLFCVQGSVKMILDNGKQREEIVLNQPDIGILLPRMVWHEMHDMDEKTILLVIASQKFDPADYIRSHNQYIKLVKQR